MDQLNILVITMRTEIECNKYKQKEQKTCNMNREEI
jgi:hypothetical protein